MIATLIFMSALGSSASCVKSSRNEPVVWIKDNTRSHFIPMLNGQEDECEQFSDLFNLGKLSRVCGCKRLITWGERDRLGLKCAHVLVDKIVSKTVAIYYYYDDGESIDYCNRLRNILMSTKKVLED